MKPRPSSVPEYIADFPPATRKLLKQLRAAIRKAAPKAEEGISYSMPYYGFHGRLVYFAAFQRHIGMYPMASGIAAFKKELSVYKGARGSVQFPLDQPLPVALITKMIKYRVNENLQKEALKRGKKK